MSHPIVFRPLQSRFLAMPQSPICYWLRERFFELLAGRTLGPWAFAEMGGEAVNTARFVLARGEPGLDHWLTAFRLVGPKSPEQKDALLREAIASLRPAERGQRALGGGG